MKDAQFTLRVTIFIQRFCDNFFNNCIFFSFLIVKNNKEKKIRERVSMQCERREKIITKLYYKYHFSYSIILN